MSEIPYYFETPVPKYFRENGWFQCEHMFKFVHWAFSKCQTVTHKTVIHGREITLAPYEFIAGRLSSSKECFLTENIFRNQQISLSKAGLLKKSTNSLTNHYTCYIWVTEAFLKNNNQPNNHQSTNRQPTVNHKERIKKIRKEDHHPQTPSFEKPVMRIDDFSSKIEIYPGVLLSQAELDACVKIKGDIDQVKHAIGFIQNSKRRKRDITDWPNTLVNWKIQKPVVEHVSENIQLASEVCKSFSDFIFGNGWRSRIYHNKTKDEKGILFECSNANKNPIFISFSDGEFKNKCYNVIKTKKMEAG